MQPKKPATVEILPAIVRQDPETRLQALLAPLVEEIRALRTQRQALEPMEVTLKVRQQSMFERHFNALYYEKWGCLDCKSKKDNHGSNRLCPTCQVRDAARKRQLRRKWDEDHPDGETTREIERLDARVLNAERLLGTGEQKRRR